MIILVSLGHIVRNTLEINLDFIHRRGQHLRNELYSKTLGLYRKDQIDPVAISIQSASISTDYLWQILLR